MRSKKDDGDDAAKELRGVVFGDMRVLYFLASRDCGSWVDIVLLLGSMLIKLRSTYRPETTYVGKMGRSPTCSLFSNYHQTRCR